MKLAFGLIGVGKIGGALALRARDEGVSVIGYRRSGLSRSLTNRGVQEAKSAEEVARRLKRPRRILLCVPAGPTIDQILEALAPHLDRGDVVADGGNSYWGDSIRRYRRLRRSGIHFLDVGTSGGVPGARRGACFMVGGTRAAYRRMHPLLRRLALDETAVVHCGPSGTGHFVKLVHNGIEFGMMQAIGEGIALLRAYRPKLPVTKILDTWNHGSVIRSWLLHLLATESAKRGADSRPGLVEDTGEVNWLVDDAMRMEVPIPVIAQSVMQLFASRESKKEWAKAIAQMRHGFGGHPYGRSSTLVRERKRSRRRHSAPRRTRAGWPARAKGSRSG